MSSTLDPRAWNLLSGLALIAGCGARTAAGDGSGGDTGDSGSGSEDPSTSFDGPTSNDESTTGECSSDADCPPGYYCIEGMCEYQIAPDGAPWYECYAHEDCGPFSLCVDYSCQGTDQLGGCEPSAAQPIPRNIDGAPLALSFVDLDDDGADELVVATADELHAFESDVDPASVSPRQYVSASIPGMAAGHFDAQPGEDLILIAEGQLAIHPADGVAGFGMPSVGVTPVAEPAGVVAAEVDGEPGTEYVVWGSGGAAVTTGLGTLQFLSAAAIGAASVRGPSADMTAYVVRMPGELLFLGLGGVPLGTLASFSQADEPLVSVYADDEWLELDAAQFDAVFDQPWTLLYLLKLGQAQQQWGVDGLVTAMAAGDLDGDGREEVALLFDSGVVDVLQNVGTQAECTLTIASPAGASLLAVGDWDGDGDDELAIAAVTGELLVHDTI